MAIEMAGRRGQGSGPVWRDALRRVRLVTATTERGPPTTRGAWPYTLRRLSTSAFQLTNWVGTSRRGYKSRLTILHRLAKVWL